MLNVRLACDHLFGKLLFTWLSLVMSMMVSFVLSFFPRDVLDEILNLIESVSEDFPSYSYIDCLLKKCKDYLLYFQKRLLTTSPGRAERRKRKKKPEAARRKSYPIRPMTSKLRHTDISATSSRRIDVSTTLFWRPTPAGLLLKKVKAQPHMTSY